MALNYGIIHYAIIQKHDHWAIIESYNLIIASGNQAREWSDNNIMQLANVIRRSGNSIYASRQLCNQLMV